MFDLTAASVQIRTDLPKAFRLEWSILASAGGALTGEERVEVAAAARGGGLGSALHDFAEHLYSDPASVEAKHVDAPAEEAGYPATVETIGIVSRLSAVDRFHSVVGLDLPALPEPIEGSPTGEIEKRLKKRRGHVPMPPGAIPASLDLVPSEGRALMSLHGPMYMTGQEMGDPLFGRVPGLNRAQLELVAARTSFINECFY